MKNIFFCICTVTLICLLTGCAAFKGQVSSKSMKFQVPREAAEFYCDAVTKPATVSLEQVTTFKSGKHRDFFLRQVEQQTLPLLKYTDLEQFKELTSRPIGIHLLDVRIVKPQHALALIHFNEPNLIYGFVPDQLEFIDIDYTSNGWKVKVDFDYEFQMKEKKLQEESTGEIVPRFKLSLEALKKEYKKVKKMDEQELLLEKEFSFAKADMLKKLHQRRYSVPHLSTLLEAWKKRVKLYRRLSAAEMRQDKLYKLKKQIEQREKLLED